MSTSKPSWSTDFPLCNLPSNPTCPGNLSKSKSVELRVHVLQSNTQTVHREEATHPPGTDQRTRGSFQEPKPMHKRQIVNDFLNYPGKKILSAYEGELYARAPL